MIVDAQITIKGSKEAVWAALTNVEKAADFMSGIEKVEILERPVTGLVGLAWRETRMYFGKPASVEKRVTQAVDNAFFETQAESDGFLFVTTNRLVESGNGVTLTSAHETRPQGFIARLKSTPMFLFKGVIRKAILQDLNDIKAAVERAV